MFRNKLIIAFRHLFRDRFYNFLNGCGLAFAMAAALLIFVWANDELTFDNFHQKGDRIYRVLATWPKQPNLDTIALTPLPLADAAREGVPEIEQFIRLWNMRGAVLKHSEKRFGVEGLYLADKEFLEAFDFPFVQGSPQSAFSLPNNIVLTETLAQQIFGTTDVVGQPLKIAGEIELVVSGIMADVPSNSHIRFEALLPLRENIKVAGGKWIDSWDSNNFDTYVLLRPGVDLAVVEKKISALPEKGDVAYKLQPLSDVYLHSDFVKYSAAPKGNFANIRLIGLIGLLILLIACINYVNISTARQVNRAKVVGIQKIVGANRWAIFLQFFTEAVILVGLACIVAMSLANLSLDYFAELTGKHFARGQLYSVETAGIIFGTALLAVLLAGILPAVQLSNFRPLETLRGDSFSRLGGKNTLRKVLVAGQFACSGALIIGTFIMLAQLHFVKQEKLGYEREHVFTFRVDESEPLQIINELQNEAGIADVAASNFSITNISNQYMGFDFEGKDPATEPFVRYINPDEKFLEFFGLELAAGRWFLPGNEDYNAFILNETAVRSFGLEDPIGKWVAFNGTKAPIVGVLKDFHFRSLHHPIEPMIMSQNPSWFRQIYVKTTGANAATAIAAAERVFSQHEPVALFNHQFLDESYEQLYQSETRSGQLFLLFAVLAIFISCLGVFGLATYAAERRTKEIGIRKIMGAKVMQIVGLLARDFMKPVILSMCIASCLAWYFLRDWLQHFAYRIDMPWWVFILASILITGLAFLTIGMRSVKAALANPSDSLRNE
ncbi:MAG: ABC transporter permease [Bacteroidota bacterium]